MNIHWIKRYNFWNSSFLTFPHRSFILVDRKSAADERLALSITQRNEPTTLGSMGGSFLFLCRWGFERSILRSWWLKIRFQNHSWYHPSLRVGLRDFSYSRNVPHTVRKIRIWGPNRPPFYGSTRTAYCSSFLFYQKSPYMAMFLFDTHGHQFAV